MTASTKPVHVGPSLWNQAFDSLDEGLKSSLSSTRTQKRDVLEAVLKEIEAKRDPAVRKRWKFKKSNGDVVIVRDVLEKIAKWINRFKQTGDIIAQHDPAHLSLPWAAFRFLLHIPISEIQVFGVIANDLRLIKSPFRTFDETQMQQILARKTEVLQIAKLIDSEKLLNLDAAVTRLSTQADIYSQSFSEQEYNGFVSWLSALPHYRYHQFIIDSRLPKLGTWLFRNKDYIEWQTSSSSFLMVHGIVGSGKSMLCSMIADTLLCNARNNPAAAPFGYIYCANPDFEKKYVSSDDVMRSILGQLALDRNSHRTIKDVLYSEFERQIAKASVDGLDLPKLKTQDCVRLVLELAEEDPLIIIIDAIDTVTESERFSLISALKEIVWKADNIVKILVTSRSSSYAGIESAATHRIQITSHGTQQDMGIFVNHLIDCAVASERLLEGRVSQALRELMMEALLDEAGEMFLWAKLQVERLCLEKTEDDVRIVIRSHLPVDLDQIYQRSLSHIYETGIVARDVGVRALFWILHMREPLTPSALLIAVAESYDSRMQLSQLLALYANLVVLDKNSNVIRFAHQSVKEFLERNDAFTGSMAHGILASTCVKLCSQGPISGNILCYPSDDIYVYAALYWPIHLKLALGTGVKENDHLVNTLTSFIFDEEFDTTLSFDSWLEARREIVPYLPIDHAMKTAPDAIPDSQAGVLFLASAFGLTDLLRVIFEHIANLDVNQRNKHGYTPVYLAAALGHSATLALLVQHRAHVNVECGKYGSPSHAACFAGHLEIVKTLLQLGAEMSCGAVFDDAFQAAYRGGQEGVVLLLIDTESRIQFGDRCERILEDASRAGFINVIEKLRGPPFLLSHDTNIDKVRKKTRKAIQGDEGMSIEAEGPLGRALRTASLLNHYRIARLLLQRGADVNACGTYGDALQAAAMKGHVKLLKLLIDEGSKINQQGGFYGTALQATAFHGQQGAVEFLLDVNANVHVEGYSKDAFHAAAEGGHQGVMTLMLRKGYKSFHAPRKIRCKKRPYSRYKALMRDASPGRTLVANEKAHLSSAYGKRSPRKTRPITELETIFRVAECDPGIANVHYEEVQATGFRSHRIRREKYPLEAAASAGHESSVKVLLEQRKVIGIPDVEIDHAIQRATSNSHWPIVQLLLDNVAKWHSVRPYIESIFETTRCNQESPVVDLAIAWAFQFCPADEAVEIKRKLAIAGEEPHFDPISSREPLVSRFARGCKNGDVKIIDAILGSNQYEALTSREIDAGLQLCVLNGQDAIIQLLHQSPVLKERLPPSIEEAFALAAADGSVDMMRLLFSYWTAELGSPESNAIIRALVVASGNGHINAVRYLVQEISAEVNTSADDKPVGPSLNKNHIWSGLLFKVELDNAGRHWPVNDEAPTIKKANQSEYEETIHFLLDNGSNCGDLGGQDVYPIQIAAEFCPSAIVENFVSKGVDVNATLGGKSALFAAAGRELSSAIIVRQLLAAGAMIPEKFEEKQELLNQALRYFDGNTSRASFLYNTGDPDGHFLEAPSLHYVFSEGPGAVLVDLLHLMPQIRTTDGRWTLVLQMAAQLNKQVFVSLLVTRGTDVNALGYYYGTAIEAAARCGHISIVQKLLSLGARVNVVRGRWQTALRAAIFGGHEDIVDTLLAYGADVYAGERGKASDGPLQLGVQSGSINIVRTLLRHGARAEHDESENLHPLIQASRQGDSAMVNLLLAAGAPINVPRKTLAADAFFPYRDASPIHAAIAGGYLEILEILVYQGADIEIDVEGSGKPLSAAASEGQADMVRLLLLAGANATDSAALRSAITSSSVEIAQDLLAADSKADPALALACRQGFLPMIELLLEEVYRGDEPDIVIDEVFDIPELSGSVLRLLLEYAHPTMRRFSRLCAAGSVASLEVMLKMDRIDVNGQIETDGDHPLQVAALHLQAGVVRLLLSNGADANCYSAKHGTPLMTALEACGASTLRGLSSKKERAVVDQLNLPSSRSQMSRNNFQQISDCEHIVRLLIDYGASIADDGRLSGSPLHLACFLSSKGLTEVLIEKGADPSLSAGYFEKTIFAAILGGHVEIVDILLQKAPLVKCFHPDYATPLHLACARGQGAIVRKLLQHGADATLLDTAGRTPLTIALETQPQRFIHNDSLMEGPLEVMLKLAKPLYVLNSDLVKAIQLPKDTESTLCLLLDSAKDLIVSEDTICHLLDWPIFQIQILHLLMRRNGGIGASAQLLSAITPDILVAQKELNCMKLLLDFDPEAPVTQEVIFRALELRNVNSWDKAGQAEVLETLLDRCSEVSEATIAKEMLQAVRTAKDMETLLNRLDPGTRISTDVVTSVSKLQHGEAYRTMLVLLEFDPSIKSDHNMALQMIEPPVAIDALETFMERDPSLLLPEEAFLRVFGQNPIYGEPDRLRLIAVMQKYGKRLVITDRVRERIDHVYQSNSDGMKKEKFYSLQETQQH
ncbi:hypothetical protein ACLMJK_009170 [Lecanora helva]